jgi:subtilase family serine protease
MPAALAKVGATVGFAMRLAQVNSKLLPHPVTNNRYSPTGPYWFTDLKQAYGYPSYQTANGQGRTIAIVIDSDVLDSDLALYFGHEKLAPPVVERRPVNGGPHAFNSSSGSSIEASLDVQQSFGSAPGAHIMLYGIPLLSQEDITFAYQAIVDDNKADIVNMSFGLCELFFTAPYNGGVDFTSIIKTNHDIFRQGNAQGISFVNSSGDNGAFQCTNAAQTEFIKGVQNPSDDTAVTSVGGTDLVTNSVNGGRDSRYVRESEFFDQFDVPVPNDIWGPGGGISVLFAKPWYQNLVQTHANTRTIPDIALHMGGCPQGSRLPCNPDDSSVVVAIDGGLFGVIGTSAASPDIAGLLAVTEQTLGGRLGNANGYIYTLASTLGPAAFRQNIPGNNGYPALNGYDYVTGNGTPIAAVFAGQPTAPRAGEPQTPTNP